MRIALGWKAHSGWAALVAVGLEDGAARIVERRRVELVDEADRAWAKQPYHAAEGLEPADARDVVERAVAAARRVALRETKAALARAGRGGHDVAACAVLAPAPMPAWSVQEILAVHFRMHKAEGVLFPDALLRAAYACDLRGVSLPEKTLGSEAPRVLARPLACVTKQIDALGKSVGPPWGKDQKGATLAALVALAGGPPARARSSA